MADILIVEDNESLSRAFSMGLELHGHVVRVARDEDGLRQALEVRHPDLILLDVGLPGVDGVEILRGLREETETAAIKVAVISNYTDRNLIHRALRLDALDYIEKASLTPTLLADQVRRWLEG
ncbi:MAG: response regulator [Candidatus Dormibacteria bacterium]